MSSKQLYKIEKINAPFKKGFDFYHSLLKVSWFYLLLYYLIFFLTLNCFFGMLYFLNPLSLTIQNASFVKCFFFSVQTFSTVGYGAISPNSLYGDIVVSVEIIVGLLTVALTTGLIFAKFSRPVAKIIFSKNLLITNFNNERVLMFRCANGRNNQIISASVELHLLFADQTSEGHSITRFIPLKLQKSYSPIFALSWSVFHTIDLSSPLFGLTKEEMLQKKYEFIIVINGTDDIYTQTIHQTKYYTPLDIEFDKYFIDILQRKPDGTRTIDYQNFNQFKEV